MFYVRYVVTCETFMECRRTVYLYLIRYCKLLLLRTWHHTWNSGWKLIKSDLNQHLHIKLKAQVTFQPSTHPSPSGLATYFKLVIMLLMRFCKVNPLPAVKVGRFIKRVLINGVRTHVICTHVFLTSLSACQHHSTMVRLGNFLAPLNALWNLVS